MSEEAINPRIATGETHEKEAKDRTPQEEKKKQYGWDLPKQSQNGEIRRNPGLGGELSMFSGGNRPTPAVQPKARERERVLDPKAGTATASDTTHM